MSDTMRNVKAFQEKSHIIAVATMTSLAALFHPLLTRQTYSCNLCGYCKSICPESVDIGEVLRLSRRARMNANIHPAALQDFWLREMDFATTTGAYTSAPKGKEQCEYAFFPGCQLGAAAPGYVLQSYSYLAQNYDTGIMLTCCGAPAYWAGDDKRLEDNLAKSK